MNRPNNFSLNYGNPLYGGLVAAYLGNGITSSSGNGTVYPESRKLGGTPNNGVLTGSYSGAWSQDTYGRWGLAKTAAGQYVNLSTVEATLMGNLSASLPFTFSIWVKYSTFGYDYTGPILNGIGISLAAADSTNDYAGVVIPTGGNTIVCPESIGSGSPQYPGVSLTAWHNIVGTYNGSGLSYSNFGWWVDGVSYPLAGTNPYNSAMNGLYAIQTDNNTGSRGIICDPMIWSRVLTSTEINILHTSPAFYGGLIGGIDTNFFGMI
jgi:hypothetical protein